MAATPVRLVQAERAIEGLSWNEAAVERVQQAIASTLTPMTDHRGSAHFRLEVAKRLIEKFYWERAR
jgi:xanthine dehydrogenase small subunit